MYKKNFFDFFFDFSSIGVSMKKIENFRFFKISLKTCFSWFSYMKNTILMLKKFEINVKKWVLVYFWYNLDVRLLGRILAISFYGYFQNDSSRCQNRPIFYEEQFFKRHCEMEFHKNLLKYKISEKKSIFSLKNRTHKYRN